MTRKSVRDLNLRNQLILLRVDFNVPLDKKQQITEDARIVAALPTIQYILEKGGRLVIASHLGRPTGGFDARLGMRPVAKRLQELLIGVEVRLAPDCVGTQVEKMKSVLRPGDILLLENLRFYAQEEENDLHFAEQLAANIDVYVSDAFGALHRKHASTYAVPSLIFDKGVGMLIEKEIKALDAIREPEQPLVVIIGGAKIADKIEVIRVLLQKSDVVLVGGGIANAFFQAQGMDVGRSLVESVDVAAEIWKRSLVERPTIDVLMPDGTSLPKIVLPIDGVVASNVESGSESRVVEHGAGSRMPKDWMFVDIGPKTAALYASIIARAKTVFWNGPLGVCEVEAYAAGSRAVAAAIADASAYSVLGGGDTEALIQRAGLHAKFAHVSTGGGASLEYIASGSLPGLEALES